MNTVPPPIRTPMTVLRHPRVAAITPWTVNVTIFDGSNTTHFPLTENLLPFQMSIQLGDNKIVAAPGAQTNGTVVLNAPPSPAWFPAGTIQSSTSNVNVNYSWPNEPLYVGFSLTTSQNVTNSYPATISADLESTNGVQVTASADISLQPPSDPGECDDPCDEGGAPINFATGNVFIREKDFSLPGLGGGLQLNRTWNSLWQNIAPPTSAGIFGTGWRSNFEEQLYLLNPNTVTYYRNDGSSWVFDSDGTMVSPGNAVLQNCGPSIQLCFDPTVMQYWMVFADGTEKLFSQLGALEQIIDRNGNATTFGYDDKGRLNSVNDAAGHSISLNYGDPNNIYQATSVQDAVGVLANYIYDQNSDLTRVTYADGSSLNFSYGENSLITSITDAQGKLIESHTYDAAGRGLSSSRADGADGRSDQI